jgi:N-methylhydantoinase A
MLGTDGFRDSIENPAPLARQPLGSSHAAACHRRRSVTERIDVDGNIVGPLDPASVRNPLDRRLGSGVESIAICFLHSDP